MVVLTYQCDVRFLGRAALAGSVNVVGLGNGRRLEVQERMSS